MTHEALTTAEPKMISVNAPGLFCPGNRTFIP